jgi:hypothetical protein
VIPEVVGSPVDQQRLQTPFFIGKIYDMCKAADRGMVMTDVRLLDKQGGKSGHWVAAA